MPDSSAGGMPKGFRVTEGSERFYSIIEGTLIEWAKNEPQPLWNLMFNMCALGHLFHSRKGSDEGCYRIDIDESLAHALAEHLSGRLPLEIDGQEPFVRPMDLARWIAVEETDLPVNQVFVWAACDLRNETGGRFRDLLNALTMERERTQNRRPDPLENTRATCWTKEDRFHFETSTQGNTDGLRVLEASEGNVELLHVLCAKWPSPISVGEIMEALFDGQRDAKARGRTRTLFREERDLLEKAGINPDVIPRLDTQIEQKMPIRLRIQSLRRLEDGRDSQRGTSGKEETQ